MTFDPIRQQRTHRLQRYYNANVTCFVRDAEGPMDVSSATALTATVRPYQTPRWKPLATSTAVQIAPGEVVFPITSEQMAYMGAWPDGNGQFGLSGGYSRNTLFQFDVDADGELIYSALLELV